MNPSSIDPKHLASHGQLTRRAVLGGVLGGAAALALTGRGQAAGHLGRLAGGAGLPGASPADWEAEWEEVIAAARTEGELVAMFGASTSVAEEQIREEFTKRYGVRISLVPGGNDETTNRVLAEHTQGIYSVDLAATGPSGISRMLEAGIIAPLEPVLLLPEVIDRSEGWRVTYMPWAELDIEGKYVTYYALTSNRNISRIFYNTDNVSAEEIESVTSWRDFLDPAWKGRLAIHDISEASVGQRVATWTRVGGDFWDQLMRTQDVAVWADGADTNFANAILLGDQDVALISGGAEGAMIDAMGQGLPIDEWPNTLAEGPAAAYGGMLGVVQNAPHPNAVKLYINWLLSREGGTVYNELTVRPTVHLRSDVPQGNLDDEVWERANSVDFSTLLPPNSPEYRQANDDATTFWVEIFEELGITPNR